MENGRMDWLGWAYQGKEESKVGYVEAVYGFGSSFTELSNFAWVPVGE